MIAFPPLTAIIRRRGFHNVPIWISGGVEAPIALRWFQQLGGF
jgi:hypothetical protein